MPLEVEVWSPNHWTTREVPGDSFGRTEISWGCRQGSGGECEGPRAHREGVLSHCLDHISEEDLGSEGVAVIDDRLTSWPLPAVQLHTAASLGKGPVDRRMDKVSCGWHRAGQRTGLQVGPRKPTVGAEPLTTPKPAPRPAYLRHPHIVVPDVGLSAAGSPDLRVGQIGVVGGGDEVVGKGLVHVLEHACVGWVQGSPLRGQQVHHEAIQCHQLMLLGCRKWAEESIRLCRTPVSGPQNLKAHST